MNVLCRIKEEKRRAFDVFDVHYFQEGSDAPVEISHLLYKLKSNYRPNNLPLNRSFTYKKLNRKRVNQFKDTIIFMQEKEKQRPTFIY